MSPRNFDEARDAEDLSFVIRGETFKFKRVPYTVLDEIELLQTAFREKATEGEATWADTVEFALARLLLLLETDNGSAERFTALTTRDDDPVTYSEIMQISRWAYEEATGVPTMPPTPSQPGPGNTGGSSKAASPSPAAASRR